MGVSKSLTQWVAILKHILKPCKTFCNINVNAEKAVIVGVVIGESPKSVCFNMVIK
jgi:hypothetical protein